MNRQKHTVYLSITIDNYGHFCIILHSMSIKYSWRRWPKLPLGLGAGLFMPSANYKHCLCMDSESCQLSRGSTNGLGHSWWARTLSWTGRGGWLAGRGGKQRTEADAAQGPSMALPEGHVWPYRLDEWNTTRTYLQHTSKKNIFF